MASWPTDDIAVLMTGVVGRLRLRPTTIAIAATLALSLTACASGDPATSPSSAAPSPVSPESPTPTSGSSEPSTNQVEGTIVHFVADQTVVEVEISADTATTRDFLSMLPMTLEFEDFHHQEKIAYPPRPFDYSDATAITPQPGDLFSYIPWGNLGFFYNTDGLGQSNDLVRLGTTDDLDKIMDLDGQQVTIEVAS